MGRSRGVPLRAGFTLIEVLIATVLVGLSIAALVGANGSFSMANDTGADLSTAEFLLEQIRELTALLPVAEPNATSWTALGPESGEVLAVYDDVDDFNDFDSAVLGAPIDARRTTLPALAAFRQQVFVQKLDPSDFNRTLISSDPLWASSDFARVTVNVLQNGRRISSTSWIRARY